MKVEHREEKGLHVALAFMLFNDKKIQITGWGASIYSLSAYPQVPLEHSN
jgi:hypothetical protein